MEGYAAAAGITTDQARAGFLLGLLVRAAFAIPVVTRLPHPTPRSRQRRRRAVERLAALLREHADEIADRGLLGRGQP